MDLLMSLFIVVLFVALTPGVLVTLPTKGSKLTVAIVHGLVFAVVYHFMHKLIVSYLYEGFATRRVVRSSRPQVAAAGRPRPRVVSRPSASRPSASRPSASRPPVSKQVTMR